MAGFAFLAILATWPLAARFGSALPRDLGDPLLNAWILGWDAERLRHGLAGLWDAPIFFPYSRTLAYSEHLLALAVPVAPVVWLTGNPILAYNLGFLFTYVLAGTGMFLLARHITHRDDAALIAALIYGFGPQRADQIGQLQVLASGWMPISLLALHQYFATLSTRALLLFAGAFLAQALSNGYFLYFLALPAVVIVANEFVARREQLAKHRTQIVCSLAAAMGAIVLAMTPVALAYLDVRRMYGFRRSYSDLVSFSADLSSYVHVGEAVRLWRPWLAQNLAPERQLFPGVVAIVFAALALWPRRTGTKPAQVQADGQHLTWCYALIGLLALVLSLGPEPAAWGRRLLPTGPYLWLASIVPGLDGLRAPARFSVVVFLALSVLAAIGAARILSNLSRVQAAVAAATLTAAVIAEGWSAPIRFATLDPYGRAADRPLYEWLAQRPQGGVLELPIRAWDITPTLTYQYATLFHHHPIVNGYSGYGSALQELLGGAGSPLNDFARIDAAVEMLRAIGIRYILIHPADYVNPVIGTETVASIRSLTDQLVDTREFDAAIAFELAEHAPIETSRGNGIPLPTARLRATASHSPERLEQAFDSDRDSRWLTGSAQAGDEWIEIRFDRPIDLAGVRILMARRSYGDYPRGLTIESIAGDGTRKTLREGPVLMEFAKGILADGAYPAIDLELPANSSAAVRLRQTGTVRTWFWSVHEIQVLTR